MRDFTILSEEDIRWLWRRELILSSEIRSFQEELVRRGFVSWDEINTKFVCEVI